MNLRSASADEAEALAEIHAAAFETPWSGRDIAELMAGRGAFALAAETPERALAAFILCQVIAGEAEVLTLAVRPSWRRKGLARALLEAALGLAGETASAMFLEVAADNLGALALYEAAGFAPVGRRSGYYLGRAGPGADAVVMRRTLNS
ncbi:MAG: GNAT family N-acetyltransferase [Caulobacterales bacterium]